MDEDAAKVANDSDPRPGTFDILALILWINSGGVPTAGYTAP